MPMRFVIDFVSRLHVSPAAHAIGSEPATSAPASPELDDGPVAARGAAIFEPIMASLERIEQYIDALPDKPAGAA